MASPTPPLSSADVAADGGTSEPAPEWEAARVRLLRFAGVLFLMAAALGVAVLASFLLDMPVESGLLVGAQPNAASCVVLLGVALRALLAERRRWRTMGAAIAILIAELIALLTLFEAGLELELGIGMWLGPSAAVFSEAQLRLSATTAISLSLLGLAACSLRARRRVYVIALAALPLLLSLGELVGYVYGVRLSGVFTAPLVAPNAVGVALLSAGLISTRLLPETMLLLVGAGPSSVAVRRLLIGLFAIPLILGALELTLERHAHIDDEQGIALLSVSNVLLLLSLSLWYTRSLLLAQQRQRALERDLAHKEALLEVDMRMRAERFRAQLALQRSEEKYRTLAIHAPVGIFETDAAGGCVFVNRKWMELTELTLEEALDTGWEQAVFTEDRPRLARDWIAAVEHGDRFDCEYRYLSKSGNVAWVHGTAVPLRDAVETITGYIGTIVDVSEQKRTIDALAKSEANFRTLVERAPFGVAVFRNETIVYANRECLELFGYTDLAELVGRSGVDTLVHPSARGIANERRRATEAGALIPSTRLRCIAKDGSDLFVEGASASILFDGEPSIVAVVRDVTEHERIEQVRILAERALRDSLREKEVLLKEIHHRVKNNLQVIVSLINLQASKIEDRSTRTAFDETRSRVHAIALLHERLYRSKNIGRIDMRDYLSGLASDVSSTNLDRRDIQLRVNAEDVYFDMDIAVPIGLIVNELVTNAFKHAFSGVERPRGFVEVELARRDADVLVSVTDDGRGYPPDLDTDHADTLGLLLISSLSRQLRGQLSFERLPRGARAVVRFPDPSLVTAKGLANSA